jgi:hypothetical protein
MDEPIALGPGEGGAVKADRPELSLLETTFDPGSGSEDLVSEVELELALEDVERVAVPLVEVGVDAVRAQGIGPDREFFERHDVFDV